MEGHLLSEEKDILNWEQYEETVERFIQTIARNMNLYGINPSVGPLYGVLYFAENPMTLDDMREALSMSKTSMSTGVRILSDMKMVESIHKKGVRKIYIKQKKIGINHLHPYLEPVGENKRKRILKKPMKHLKSSRNYADVQRMNH